MHFPKFTTNFEQTVTGWKFEDNHPGTKAIAVIRRLPPGKAPARDRPSPTG